MSLIGEKPYFSWLYLTSLLRKYFSSFILDNVQSFSLNGMLFFH